MGKMKIFLVTGHETEALERQVNRWLSQNKVKITSSHHTEDDGVIILIIFYKKSRK
jgi:hypothetical protein